MIADFGMTYKGYHIDYYANTGCWWITKTAPGKFFEKVVHIKTLYGRQSCIDFIDSL